MTQRLRLLYLLAATSLAIGACLRAWLWWHFGTAAGVDASALTAILAGGLLNDSIVALYLFIPLSAYLAFVPDRWYASRLNRGSSRSAAG